MRLFQMDLLRRKMAGRLAEILGTEVLASDRWHRTMGFAGVSSAVLASIPDDQRKVLESYSEGVNQAMADFDVLPFEFLMLGYSPEPWRPEDSLLAVLSMYTMLTWRGETGRATTVMRAAMPGRCWSFSYRTLMPIRKPCCRVKRWKTEPRLCRLGNWPRCCGTRALCRNFPVRSVTTCRNTARMPG